MTHYTVCCGYASHYHNTVTIEADTSASTMPVTPTPEAYLRRAAHDLETKRCLCGTGTKQVLYSSPQNPKICAKNENPR